MDISKFSDVNFNVKDWVNSALILPQDKTQESGTNTSVDGHASTLVMKLQLFIQEVNNSLEETGYGVVQSLPRVLRDIEAVRQEALLLKEQMCIVKEDIKKVESDTYHSMQVLVELDCVKTRIQESQQALQEADNWVTLVQDVEEVFATNNIEQISEKVIRMQQSLNVLHDVPDYEERKKLLESLKNRLENLLSPLLITAINNHITSDASKYVQYFKGMEREHKVRDCYIQCHKNIVQDIWSTLNDELFHNTLTSLYTSILNRWDIEYNWCTNVFPSPLSMIIKVFNDSLTGIPLGQYLHTNIYRSVSSIQALIDARNIMLKFLKNFEKSLPAAIITDNGPILYPLIECTHIPYCTLLVQYGSLQQQHLLSSLPNIKLVTNIEDNIQCVYSHISSVLSSVNEAINNCFILTDGWGVVSLIKAIETFLVQFIKKLSHTLQELHSSSTNSSTAQDDWSDLHWIFQFIQHCGELLIKLNDINTYMCNEILSCTSYRSQATPTFPFDKFDYLSMYHPEEHTAVMELLLNIEKNGNKYVLLTATTNQIKALTSTAHSLAFDVVFAQLKRKLLEIPKLKVWEKGCTSPLESPIGLDDLPSFSLSPLTYITEIGDHLLTLPEQLEPFTAQDNPSLMTAMKLGKLPYATDDNDNLSDVWLDAISRGTMETYVHSILQIPRLTDSASLQLATDIGYLCNVLAALDQVPIQSLLSLEKLLKVDKERFINYKDDRQVDSTLYTSIKQLRTWN